MGIGWSRFTHKNLSYETFTRDGPGSLNTTQAKGAVAGAMFDQAVPFLEKPYITTGQYAHPKDRTGSSRSGQIFNKVPGFALQTMRTASPVNRQQNRTGPVTQADLITGILTKQRRDTRSNAGQSTVT